MSGLAQSAAAALIAVPLSMSPIGRSEASTSPVKRCGVERQESRGQVFDVRAVRAPCATALTVAGRWFRFHPPRPGETLVGEQRAVKDTAGHAWTCRITEHVSAIDADESQTSVRCGHKTSVVHIRMHP